MARSASFERRSLMIQKLQERARKLRVVRVAVQAELLEAILDCSDRRITVIWTCSDCSAYRSSSAISVAWS